MQNSAQPIIKVTTLGPLGPKILIIIMGWAEFWIFQCKNKQKHSFQPNTVDGQNIQTLG